MNQSEKLPAVTISGDGILHCPVCGDHWLHQHEVETGWRPEDGHLIRHTSNRDGVQADTVVAADVTYGYRRQYVVMRLWCEQCGDGFELEIRQYKGTTILRWVKIGNGELQPELQNGWY